MGTRIEVAPDDFYTAAQLLTSDVFGVLGTGLDRLSAVLAGCGAMAGSDPCGLQWASGYDGAVGTALRAGADVANGAYRLVVLLEQTGINHERADAASTAGGLRAATLHGAWLHDPGFSYRVSPAPSAAGGSGVALHPPGWGLVAHAVGYVWPDGHQDRLRAAAAGWDVAAAAADSAAEATIQVWATFAADRSPEVDDATAACSGLRTHLQQLASAYRGLSRACVALAHHLDVAHAQIEHELLELAAQTGAIQTLGFVASVFSFGTAEAPTQAVELLRISAAAQKISAYLTDFVTALSDLITTIPPVTALCTEVSTALQALLDTRIVIADVTGVDGFRVLRIERLERRGQGITHMTGEARGEQELADAAADKWIDPLASTRLEGEPGRWASPRTLRKHFTKHGADFNATSPADYSTKASDFLQRAATDGLPTKIDTNGDIRVYDPATGTFGSYTSTGETRTFYKPTGSTYWDRQPGTLQ